MTSVALLSLLFTAYARAGGDMAMAEMGRAGDCGRMWSIYVNLVHLSNSEDVFLGKNGKNMVFV